MSGLWPGLALAWAKADCFSVNYCLCSSSARLALARPGIDYDEFRCHAGFHHGRLETGEGLQLVELSSAVAQPFDRQVHLIHDGEQ